MKICTAAAFEIQIKIGTQWANVSTAVNWVDVGRWVSLTLWLFSTNCWVAVRQWREKKSKKRGLSSKKNKNKRIKKEDQRDSEGRKVIVQYQQAQVCL